jgi:hypothetical protein
MALAIPRISCCIFNNYDFFGKENKTLAFNRDRCCHLALCLQLFHWREFAELSFHQSFAPALLAWEILIRILMFSWIELDWIQCIPPPSRGTHICSFALFQPQKYICKYNKVTKFGEIIFLVLKKSVKLTFSYNKFVWMWNLTKVVIKSWACTCL